MKILKEGGIYLEKKAKLNRNIAIIFFIIGGCGFLFSYLTIGFSLSIFFSIILFTGIFFSNKYVNYNSGLEAEKLVTTYLNDLDDKYYLINNVKLPESYGDIDHIVLGPNGIFVIETKDFEGNIRCNGDLWYQYKPEWEIHEEHEIEKSPSKQVKGNAVRLKKIIESENIFKKPLRFWIDGIIVFTNNNMELNLNNPTVQVLKINNLCNYIKNKESKINFSSHELESIGKAILRSTEAD